MRIHLTALPHTRVGDPFYSSCAYTTRTERFARMMTSLGHEVFLYAPEGSTANDDDQTTVVTTITQAEQEKYWGHNDVTKEFYDIEWQPELPYWHSTNAATIQGIRERAEARDIIAITGGWPQKPIAEAFPAHQSVEYGVGYSGVFSPYKVFESYAWMHWIYGKQDKQIGNWYDTVIPNYYDLADFPEGDGGGDYLLFVGRMIENKGWRTAIEIAENTGMKLVMAGQVGDNDLSLLPSHVEHVGVVQPKERAELMGGAYALLMPTYYMEPFGGVHIEAMLTGTPVITSDWGVFSETVIEGYNGFRFRTMGEAVSAVERVPTLDRRLIRSYAQQNYSMDVVRTKYEDYFQSLLDLYEAGWYTGGRTGAFRYKRAYPRSTS